MQINGCCNKLKGFTLIELLIVVLIIAVLAAIALPQYQKAVLKSRFSSLLSATKAVRDGNEAYYMDNNAYTNTMDNLDVRATGGNTTFTLASNDNYSYVKSNRPDIKNNLIMYQKHSANFPGEIHCEALKTDQAANYLCETSLHATQNLGQVITSGYNTYVLEGTGNGKNPTQIKIGKTAQWFSDLIAAEQQYYADNGSYLKDIRNIDGYDLMGLTYNADLERFNLPSSAGGGYITLLYAGISQINWRYPSDSAYSGAKVDIRLDKLRAGNITEGVTCSGNSSFCTEFLNNF